MSLRLITGRAGTGKTTFIEREIADQLQQAPIGDPIILIVPDQMSYAMESSLTSRFHLKGIVRAQVLTFKRLAWRVLQETGGIARKEVDQFGYRMLVRSILETHQENFQLFRLAANKRGFTEQMTEVLKEFSRYCLTSETLQELSSVLQDSVAPKAVQQKVHDFMLLTEKIEERLGTTYVDSEGHLALLTNQIQQSQQLAQAEVYVDGFDYFTLRELEIVRGLMTHCRRVTVVLPMDVETTELTEDHLFFHSARMYQRLCEIAQEQSVEIEERIHFNRPLRFAHEALAHVERQFEQYPATSMEATSAIQLIEAADRRAEIHAVARKIRSFVRAGKRYRDISILYRQPEIYDELIETLFAQYDIPVFVSRRKPMLHHPLIEFVRSVLEVMTSNWSYETIFRAVKTDLFFPYGEDKKLWRERADRFENYVLANGVYGKRWFDESKWRVKRYRGLEHVTTVQTDEELAFQKEIHIVRDMIREPIAELEQQLRRAKNGQEMATALFQFVDDLRVYDKIVDLRIVEERSGQLYDATEHEQAWNSWLHLLDQFVLLFGDREMTLQDTARILEEGFDTLAFTRIPPSLDQVTVTTLDAASFQEADICFVIGVNDGVLPQRIDSEGLLNDDEREWFERSGVILAPSTKVQLMKESYKAYRALTAAREQLLLTYPIADEEGKACLPSLYIARMHQLLSNLTVEQAVTDPFELPGEDAQFDYVSHPRTTLPFLTMKVREQGTVETLSEKWRAVYAYYEKDRLWSSILETIFNPIKQTKNEKLPPSMTEQLYGKDILSSVSRIESYYSCPFQHFATYGLQLRERLEYKLEAPSIGELFHAALKWISDEVIRTGLSWSNLTWEQCRRLAQQAMEELTPAFFHQILLSTSRYMYIRRKLTAVIQRTVYALTKQAAVSQFKPILVEAAFGPGESIPPLEIPLKGGRKMRLSGRIDRVDATEIDGKPYVRIVDYKSSAHQLDLAEVYYGLSLQMLTYLDVIVDYADQWLGLKADPAGVLYVHVHNPMIPTEIELTEEALEQKLLKSYKMQGYVLDDPTVVKGMDLHIGRNSDIVPVALKVDGTLSKTSKVLTTEDLHRMRQFVRKRHQQAGNAILAGDTRILPYRLKDRMPCQFCQFRPVCQFDETDPMQDFRQYAQLPAEQALDKIRKELPTDEHSN